MIVLFLRSRKYLNNQTRIIFLKLCKSLERWESRKQVHIASFLEREKTTMGEKRTVPAKVHGHSSCDGCSMLSVCVLSSWSEQSLSLLDCIL